MTTPRLKFVTILAFCANLLIAQGQFPIQNNTATWNSSTAINTTLGVDTLGWNAATVTFVPSGTLSIGTVTFEASDTANDSITSNWFSVNCAAPTTNSSTFTPVSGTNAAVQCNIVGYKRFRVRNSTPIVGSGQYLINVQASGGTVFTAKSIGSYSGRIDLAATNANIRAFSDFIPSQPVIIKRFTTFANTQAATCSTAAVLTVKDTTTSTNLSSLTIANATSAFDSGAISVAVAAGDVINMQWTTAASGCGTTPSGISFVVNYQ